MQHNNLQRQYDEQTEQKNSMMKEEVSQMNQQTQKMPMGQRSSLYKVNDDQEKSQQMNNQNQLTKVNQQLSQLQNEDNSNQMSNQQTNQNKEQKESNENGQISKQSNSNKQKQQNLNQNQVIINSNELNYSPDNNPITIHKLEGIDFTDPKNRQILEDQFFGTSDPNKQKDLEAQKQEEQQVSIPKKFQYLALFLAFSGTILIIVGFIVAFSGDSTKLMKGGAFWIIGALCCIPGIYYSIKILLSKLAKNEKEKMQAVSEIPRY